jgi:hypothetical protein
MSDRNQRRKLHEVMTLMGKRLESGRDLAPVEDREEWERLVASSPPEERRLLEELARFVDLWRYFRERNQRLGPEMVDAVRELHTLPFLARIERLIQINLELMERVGDDGPGAQSRH